MALTKKDLKETISPAIKAIHRAVNDYCVQGQARNAFKRMPGHFVSHSADNPIELEWEGFAIEVTTCRRARVVCNVPTPYSMFTFNYCLKLGGKQCAHGTTIPEFVDHVFHYLHRQGIKK